MVANDTINGTRGILRYEESLQDEIFAFQTTAYPERRPDWIAPRWRWMFVASATRLGVSPLVWLYRGPNGIAAHQGAIPVKLKVGHAEHVTSWFVETMVLPELRGRTVGPMLIARAKQDQPFSLSLGQTAQMRSIQFAMGWDQVCPLSTYAFILQPHRVLSGKLHDPLSRRVAGWALSARQAARGLAGRSRHRPKPEIREVARFNALHDRLWETVRPDYPCAVVRDASYLNWKYVDQPGQHFVRLEILRDGSIVALVVLLIREPDANYSYRRGLIVDLVAPIRNRDVVHATLDSACDLFRQHDVDMVLFDVISKPLTAYLKAYGFCARTPSRFLLVSAGGQTHENVRREILSAESWFVTHGDSDIDRPW